MAATRVRAAMAAAHFQIDDVIFVNRTHAASASAYLELIARQDLEHYQIVPEIPHTGIGYIVLEGGLTEAVVRAFGLYRLSGIRQLQFLHTPLDLVRGVKIIPSLFPHTRFQHVLDVSALATVIAKRNNLPKRVRAHLRVAALTHDALTPAGGDMTKGLDPHAFDEDAHYGRLLAQNDWAALRSAHALDPELLIATVQGRGLLGRILDFSDKIAYVGRDLMQLFENLREPWLPRADLSQDLTAIHALAREHPFACSLWESVHVRGEEAAFQDADRLAVFLRLRALMFRSLYYAPASRHLEYLLASTALRYLYATGAISAAELFRMRDHELEAVIHEHAGVGICGIQPGDLGEPEFQGFLTFAEARARQEELMDEGVVLSNIEDIRGKIKPATHLPVWVNGHAAPFDAARPELARAIQEIADVPHPIRLYWVRAPRLKPAFTRELRSFLRSLR